MWLATSDAGKPHVRIRGSLGGVIPRGDRIRLGGWTTMGELAVPVSRRNAAHGGGSAGGFGYLRTEQVSVLGRHVSYFRRLDSSAAWPCKRRRVPNPQGLSRPGRSRSEDGD